MDKVIIAGREDKGTKYCILENDGVGLCVCKHRPCEQLQRLKEENERLKKQYNCYACDSCSGKEDYINMKRHTENAIKTVHKYSQALQEIREIADIIYNTNCNYVAESHKIITKINEVIGGK